MRVTTPVLLILLQRIVLTSAHTTSETDDYAVFQRAIHSLPECALPCLIQGMWASKCNPINVTCLCLDEVVMDIALPCAIGRCRTPREILGAKHALNEACNDPPRVEGRLFRIYNDAMIVLGSVVVGLRLVAKTFGWAGFIPSSRVILGWDWDDLFILLAFLDSVPVHLICGHMMIDNGLGRDVWTLSPDDVTELAKWVFLGRPFYFLQGCLLKASFLFFFLRVFSAGGSRKPRTLQCIPFGKGRPRGVDLRKTLYGTIVLVGVVGLLFISLGLGQCQPITYAWTYWDKEHTGVCRLNIKRFNWWYALLSIALDLWILYLPLSQIPGMNLSTGKKIGAVFMFCVGTFVTVVSIVRLHTLVLLGISKNPSYDHYNMALWSSVEVAMGIICACLPAMRVIAVRTIPEGINRLKARIHGRSWKTCQSTRAAASEEFSPQSFEVSKEPEVQKICPLPQPAETPTAGACPRKFSVQRRDGSIAGLGGLGGGSYNTLNASDTLLQQCARPELRASLSSQSIGTTGSFSVHQQQEIGIAISTSRPRTPDFFVSGPISSSRSSQKARKSISNLCAHYHSQAPLPPPPQRPNNLSPQFADSHWGEIRW